MDRYVVNVLPGGRITIPVSIRKSLDLQPGDTLIWWREGCEVNFRKAKPGEVITHAISPSPKVAPSPHDNGAREEE